MAFVRLCIKSSQQQSSLDPTVPLKKNSSGFCNSRYSQAKLAPLKLRPYARLASTLLKDEERARDNHVLACKFAKIFTDFNFFSLTD